MDHPQSKVKLKTKIQGTISEQKITVDLMERGYDIALFPSDNCPIDLVAWSKDLPGNNMVRVQVKTASRRKNSYYCPTEHHKYTQFVDYMAYSYERICIYVPIECVRDKTNVTINKKELYLFDNFKPEHQIKIEISNNGAEDTDLDQIGLFDNDETT
jgi:hypothetical protein